MHKAHVKVKYALVQILWSKNNNNGLQGKTQNILLIVSFIYKRTLWTKLVKKKNKIRSEKIANQNKINMDIHIAAAFLDMKETKMYKELPQEVHTSTASTRPIETSHSFHFISAQNPCLPPALQSRIPSRTSTRPTPHNSHYLFQWFS